MTRLKASIKPLKWHLLTLRIPPGSSTIEWHMTTQNLWLTRPCTKTWPSSFNLWSYKYSKGEIFNTLPGFVFPKCLVLTIKFLKPKVTKMKNFTFTPWSKNMCWTKKFVSLVRIFKICHFVFPIPHYHCRDNEKNCVRQNTLKITKINFHFFPQFGFPDLANKIFTLFK